MLLSKFLFPHNVQKEDKSLDSQAVVVSIFGKSSFLSRSCKAEIFDKIMGYSIFKKSMLENPEINFDILCNIEGFYDKRDNIIYLHLLGTFDAHSLLKIYEQYAVQLEDKGFLTVWTDLKYKYARAVLFLFLVSHILIVAHPVHVFDLSYTQLFKAVDSVRLKLLERVSEVLKSVENISGEWLNNARFCTPRLLFYFESSPPMLKNIDDPETYTNLKKLEHSIEDQIYRILRKTRLITNSSRHSLFAIPLNQEFVFIETEDNSVKDCVNSFIWSVVALTMFL